MSCAEMLDLWLRFDREGNPLGFGMGVHEYTHMPLPEFERKCYGVHPVLLVTHKLNEGTNC